MCPFQNLSLGFILKIFLKFRKFQPRYSYKIYSYKKRVYSQITIKLYKRECVFFDEFLAVVRWSGKHSWYSIGALISLRHAYKLTDTLFVIFTRDQYVLYRSCNEKKLFW